MRPAPDELGLERDHDGDHDEDLAEPAVVADVQEVRGGAQGELGRDQTDEQGDRRRRALAEDPAVIVRPHAGEPSAGEADGHAQRQAGDEQEQLGRAVRPGEATDGDTDDGVDQGELEARAADDLVPAGLPVDRVCGEREEDENFEGGHGGDSFGDGAPAPLGAGRGRVGQEPIWLLPWASIATRACWVAASMTPVCGRWASRCR